VPRRKLPRFQQLPDVPPDHLSDPGIYLRKSALLGNMCGAIVSYNFSSGDNPHLESITTCTPAGIVQSRRAEGEDKKSPGPRLIQTNLVEKK
jgi:hypothetical protein